MLGKRSRPTTIGKPPGSPGGVADSSTSPRSPLDDKIFSPRTRSPKYFDQHRGGGVGLGIVVALNNNTATFTGEILAKYRFISPISCRSNPIPMNNNNTNNTNSSTKNHERDNNNNNHNENDNEGSDGMLEEEESFTYVTCRTPNNPKTTKVYYHGVDYGRGVFTISPLPTSSFDYLNSPSDFLSSCHLCRKTLHGKDIFMYRGENAFCSEECRQSEICKEERKERCKSEASRSTNVVVSSSPYSHTTTRPGIMAV